MLMLSNYLGHGTELIDSHLLKLRGILTGVKRANPHFIYVYE